PSPADVAVQVWLLDRELLEELHNYHQLHRPRAYQCFSTELEPVPAFAPPSHAQLRALEVRLDHFHQAWKRGPGTRVFVYAASDANGAGPSSGAATPEARE